MYPYSLLLGVAIIFFYYYCSKIFRLENNNKIICTHLSFSLYGLYINNQSIA